MAQTRKPLSPLSATYWINCCTTCDGSPQTSLTLLEEGWAAGGHQGIILTSRCVVFGLLMDDGGALIFERQLA